MYRHWTTGQDDILRRYGSLGAIRCAQMIADSYGIQRSPETTQRRASRIGVSLFEFSVCLECGRPVKTTKRTTGLCAVCHTKMYADKQAVRKIQAEIQREAVNDAELDKERRRYKANNQSARRLEAKLRERRSVAA